MATGQEAHYTDDKNRRRQQRRPLASMMTAIAKTTITGTRRRTSSGTLNLLPDTGISKLSTANNSNKNRRASLFRERRRTYAGVYKSRLLKYEDVGNISSRQLFVRVMLQVFVVLAAATVIFSAVPRGLHHPEEQAYPSTGGGEMAYYDVRRMLLRGSGDADAIAGDDSRPEAPAGDVPAAARIGTATNGDNHDDNTSDSGEDILHNEAKLKDALSPEALDRCFRRRKRAAQLSAKASYKIGREKCAAILPKAVVDRREAWLVNMHVDRIPTPGAPGAIGGELCHSTTDS